MKAQQAFTLVETLIALGIVAFAVIGLLTALNSAVDAARFLRREATVRQQLENRVARLLLDQRKNMREEIPADANGVAFLEEIKPEEVTAADRGIINGFQRIRVVARWKGSGGAAEEREASFLTLAQ